MLGGVLVAHFSWQSIFLINLPLGALAVALGMWSIRESAHPEHAAFDPLGQALSVVWLGALAYGLIAAGEHGWDSRPAGLALALAAAGLAAFVTVELRARRPVLPLGLFRDRGYAVTNFASFVLGFSGYSSLFFFSLYLQQVQGLSPLAAGSQLAPQFIASGIASTVFGKLNPRFGLPRLMIAGYALIGAAMLGMTGLDAHTPYALTCALMVLLGVGSGLALPATSMAVMATVPRERSGMASATMNALRQSGMTIGIALLGALMSARAVDALNGALARQGLPAGAGARRRAAPRTALGGGRRARPAGRRARRRLQPRDGGGGRGLAGGRRHARAGGSRRSRRCARPETTPPRLGENPACRHGRRLIAHRDFKARNLRPLFLSIGNNALRRVAAPVSSAANNTLTGTR